MPKSNCRCRCRCRCKTRQAILTTLLVGGRKASVDGGEGEKAEDATDHLATTTWYHVCMHCILMFLFMFMFKQVWRREVTALITRARPYLSLLLPLLPTAWRPRKQMPVSEYRAGSVPMDQMQCLLMQNRRHRRRLCHQQRNSLTTLTLDEDEDGTAWPGERDNNLTATQPMRSSSCLRPNHPPPDAWETYEGTPYLDLYLLGMHHRQTTFGMACLRSCLSTVAKLARSVLAHPPVSQSPPGDNNRWEVVQFSAEKEAILLPCRN